LNNETGVVERREASLLQLQITQHQETEKNTQIDMEVHGSGAREIELSLSMADSTPSLDTDRITTDQTIAA
jgi:hypothetical protein